MDALRKLFRAKDQRIITYLGLMLVVGVFIMMLSGPLFRSASTEGRRELDIPTERQAYAIAPTVETHQTHVYERALERRLEEALSLVDEAGRVRVLVSFAQGRETVFAVDRNINNSVTREEDAQGGTRYQSSQQGQDKTLIITDRAGMDRPLVIKETEPVVGGVIIIAEGGDNVLVQDALIRATSTLLGIEINRVQVMKMRNLRE